jgi:hypothetical protein
MKFIDNQLNSSRIVSYVQTNGAILLGAMQSCEHAQKARTQNRKMVRSSYKFVLALR